MQGKLSLPPGEDASSIDCDPYAHLRAAASGDLEALRALARLGEQIAIEEGDIAATIEALVFARMAAARGTMDDAQRLMGLLALAEGIVAGDPQWSDYRDQLNGEAMAVASLLADAGNRDAELALLSLGRTASCQANLNALDIRERLLGGGGDAQPVWQGRLSRAPAPPPGFILNREAGGGNANPDPPPGFKLDAPNVPIVPNVPGVR